MSNDVFLVGSNDPSPARPFGPDWTYSYEYYGTDTLAGCSYGIPLLWLFCFDAGSLITYDASDLCDSQWTVASATIETGRAGQLLVARQPRLRRWPGASAYLGEFAELVRDCGFRYLKFQPSTVSRRLSVVVGFYRVCVIDGTLPHSPADYVRRPVVPPESPTLGLGHLQFEALITTARQSANRNDFALIAMLGLLGLRIFEACGVNIGDLGEEHGHRVLRVRGKGGKVVLVPLPPAVARALDRAVDGRDDGPILRNTHGLGWTGTRPPAGSSTWPPRPGSGCRGCTRTCCATRSSPPCDPRTTMRYDRARKNLDRHPDYILAAYMASEHSGGTSDSAEELPACVDQGTTATCRAHHPCRCVRCLRRRCWHAFRMPTFPATSAEDVINRPARVQFEAFIDEHRAALNSCLDDLTEEQVRRSMVPSRTTLLGLVKHATFVEKVWFDEAISCRSRIEIGIAATPDESFILDDGDTIASIQRAHHEACEASRRAASALGLDDLLHGNRRGPLPLRWVYLHMLRELAQHCGHADILREQLVYEQRGTE